MAYRFNPPPNWPIDDASWTPPPGWQPDPTWGPAPDGWNFWVEDAQTPAADDDATRVAGAPEASTEGGVGEREDTHRATPDASEGLDDDATRLSAADPASSDALGDADATHVADSSLRQDQGGHRLDAGAPGQDAAEASSPSALDADDEQTRLAPRSDRTDGGQHSVTQDASAQAGDHGPVDSSDGDISSTPTVDEPLSEVIIEQDGPPSNAAVASDHPVQGDDSPGFVAAEDSETPGPVDSADRGDATETGSPEASAPVDGSEDDLTSGRDSNTHRAENTVAVTDETQGPGDSSASLPEGDPTAAAATDHATNDSEGDSSRGTGVLGAGLAGAGVAGAGAAVSSGSRDEGQDLSSAADGSTAGASRDGDSSETAEYGGPDLDSDLQQATSYEETGDPVEPAQSPDAGSTGRDHAGVTGDETHVSGEHAPSGHISDGDDASSHHSTSDAGHDAPVGAGSQAPSYGQDSAAQAPTYGQGSAPEASGYGQGSAPEPAGYGQASPNSYGQASPNPYGQASPAPQAYGSPNTFGQGSASDPATGDSASQYATGNFGGEPPKKGIIARFWWVGCVVLFLVVALIVALVGGLLLFGNNDEPTGQDPTSTSVEETTAEEETPTEEETTEEDAAETVTPSVLPTLGAGAKAQDVVSSDGKGTISVSMEWLSADKIPSTYGGTVDKGEYPEYLVVTAQVEVTDGTMDFYGYMFEVKTPFGGYVSEAPASYSQVDAGNDLYAPTTFKAGETYTVRILYDLTRSGGNKLIFDNYSDTYSWDVPA